MPLFDTHCHLDFDAFDDDRLALWQRCRAQGIAAMVVPGVALHAFAEQHRRVAALPGVALAYGFHPWLQNEHRLDHVPQLAAWLARPECVALGECGLDFAIDGADEGGQLALLEAQLELAVAQRKPVILHVRKAHHALLALLKQRPLAASGIVHAFSGPPQLARQYLDHGLKLGIGGTITYPRGSRTRASVAAAPLDALVLETDAPSMPLHGHQGQANSPLCLPRLLSALCALRSEPAARVEQALWDNARSLFGSP